MTSKGSSNPFSSRLNLWLKNKKPKTIASLNDIADEKSFAILFLLLMSIPALPAPTGGVTHIFEIIVAVLCIELIAGQDKLWLPKKWQQRQLPKTMTSTALPKLVSVIRWLERYTRPRLASLLRHREFLRLTGVIILVFTITAFLAPPFSGLDTLPALGVVLIAAALLLEDVVLYVAGCIVGVMGLMLVVGLSTVIVQLVNKVF
jgi:hypothetical protein